MKNDSLKNNELITGISILAVLQKMGTIELSKCMLIEPLLSYKKVLQLLTKKNSSIKSIEDLIIKESILFSDFNERYVQKFLLTINAIVLFKKLGLLEVKDNLLVYKDEGFYFNNIDLGEYAIKRVKAANNLANILKKGEASDLYLSLRIEL